MSLFDPIPPLGTVGFERQVTESISRAARLPPTAHRPSLRLSRHRHVGTRKECRLRSDYKFRGDSVGQFQDKLRPILHIQLAVCHGPKVIYG